MSSGKQGTGTCEQICMTIGSADERSGWERGKWETLHDEPDSGIDVRAVAPTPSLRRTKSMTMTTDPPATLRSEHEDNF
jgi:hypothetical protein